jgi:hypothetical protein
MTTGVDAQTCRVIVLDQSIQSMTEFKQIIGRGTRIKEDYGKLYFTILDFKKATELFADPAFDGDPEKVYVPPEDGPIAPPDDDNAGNIDLAPARPWFPRLTQSCLWNPAIPWAQAKQEMVHGLAMTALRKPAASAGSTL